MTLLAPGWPSSAAWGREAERRSLLLAFGAFGLSWGALSALLPALQRDTGVGDGGLGLALGVLAVAALPAMPAAGRLADRVGPGLSVQWSLLLFAAAAPLVGLADGLVALVLAAALLGAATGALDVTVNAAVAAWERAEGPTGDRLMALVHASFSFGVLLGSAVTGALRELGATPLPVLLLVGGLTAAVAVRVPGHHPQPRHEDASDDGRRRLPGLGLVVAGLLVGGSLLVEDGLQSWSALHLERSLGAGPAVSGLGPGVFAAAMGLGRVASHALGRLVDERVQLVGSGVLTGAGTLLVVVAESPTQVLLGLVVAGAGTSVVAPVLLGAVGRAARDGRQGADVAVATVLGYAGSVAGPPAVGALSSTRSLPFALGLLGVVGLVVGLSGPLALRRRARPGGAGSR